MRYFFENGIGVDDSILSVIFISIIGDDDGTSGEDVVELEGVFVFMSDFDILIEQSEVFFLEVLLLFSEFLFD